MYRDWQYLNQHDNSSNEIQAQLQRWLLFLEQWERALLEGKEVLVLGDMNLDFLKWTKTVPTNSMAHRLRPLVDNLFSQILPYGVTQCVSVPTRQWPGEQSSGLDHIYSNKPEKPSDIKVDHQGASDHKLLFVIRYSKIVINKPRIVKKRSYRNFDPSQFLLAVRNMNFWNIYSCDDVEEAVKILSDDLNKILDDMAPIKTIQVRAKYCPWLSDTTKALQSERNRIQKDAEETKNEDD